MKSYQVKKTLGLLSKPQLISLNKEFHHVVPVLATKKQLIGALLQPALGGGGRPDDSSVPVSENLLEQSLQLDKLPDPALFKILPQIGYFQTLRLKLINQKLNERLERPEYKALIARIKKQEVINFIKFHKSLSRPYYVISLKSAKFKIYFRHVYAGGYTGVRGVASRARMPPGLSLFQNLKKVEILNVKEFPIEVTALSKLRYLTVGGSFESIPPEIGNLKKLRHLILKTTASFTLPAEFGQLENLRQLNLSAGLQVPQEIGQIPNLILYNNRISLTAWHKIYRIERLRYLSPKLSPEAKAVELVRPIPYNEFRFVEYLLRIGALDNTENIEKYLHTLDSKSPIKSEFEYLHGHWGGIINDYGWRWRYFEWVQTEFHGDRTTYRILPATLPEDSFEPEPLKIGLDRITYQKILSNLPQLRTELSQAKSYNDFKNRIIDIVGTGQAMPYGWTTKNLAQAILASNLPVKNKILDIMPDGATQYSFASKLVNIVLYLLLLDDYRYKSKMLFEIPDTNLAEDIRPHDEEDDLAEETGEEEDLEEETGEEEDLEEETGEEEDLEEEAEDEGETEEDLDEGETEEDLDEGESEDDLEEAVTTTARSPTIAELIASANPLPHIQYK